MALEHFSKSRWSAVPRLPNSARDHSCPTCGTDNTLIPLSLPSLHADDLAPPHEYEGRTIEQLRFEPQLQPVSRADLARLVPFKPGMPLRLAEVRDAIKRMYGTGEYADIEISTEPSATG